MNLRRAQNHNHASEHKLFDYHLYFWRYWGNKNRNNGEKVRREERGFRMEWVNSILTIPAPSSALQAKNGRALQGIAKKGHTWESPRKKNWGMQASTVRCADESIQGYSGEVL